LAGLYFALGLVDAYRKKTGWTGNQQQCLEEGYAYEAVVQS
jgi:hypothetical protein